MSIDRLGGIMSFMKSLESKKITDKSGEILSLPELIKIAKGGDVMSLVKSLQVEIPVETISTYKWGRENNRRESVTILRNGEKIFPALVGSYFLFFANLEGLTNPDPWVGPVRVRDEKNFQINALYELGDSGIDKIYLNEGNIERVSYSGSLDDFCEKYVGRRNGMFELEN